MFVALSIHIRTLTEKRNAELRSVARSIFLGYVVSLGVGFLALMPQTLWAFGLELLALNLAASIPFTLAARSGLRATGVGFDRRVTMLQFVAGFGLFALAIAGSIGVAVSEASALYVVAGIAIVALLWGLFNTWELIFRMQSVGG